MHRAPHIERAIVGHDVRLKEGQRRRCSAPVAFGCTAGKPRRPRPPLTRSLPLRPNASARQHT